MWHIAAAHGSDPFETVSSRVCYSIQAQTQWIQIGITKWNSAKPKRKLFLVYKKLSEAHLIACAFLFVDTRDARIEARLGSIKTPLGFHGIRRR